MRNRFVTALVVSIATLLGVTACSSDDENAPVGVVGPNGGPGSEQRLVRVEELRTQIRPVVDAECQWKFRCCNADERASLLGPTTNAEECVDRSLAAASRGDYYASYTAGPAATAVLRELNRLGYGYDFGRIVVDAAAIQACVTKIGARACTTPPPKDHCAPGEPPPIEDPCAPEKLLVGKQKLGEPCATQSTDCAPELRCALLDGNDGVCVDHAKLGETCFRDNECGTKLVCDGRTGRCVAGGDVGAACSFTNPDRPAWELTADRCRPGLQCDTVTLKCSAPTCAGGNSCGSDSQCPVGTTCVVNRCGVPVKDGEPCNTDANCAAGRCRYDAARFRNLCAPPSPDGALCPSGSDKDCASRYCKYDGAISAYVCKPTLPTGTACPEGDRQCVSGRCRPGVSVMECAAPVPAGQTCAVDQDCSPPTNLFCVGLKCASPPFDNGSACTQTEQCKSKLCSKGKCSAYQQAGQACAMADTAPCDPALYCDGPLSGPNTCSPKKPYGATCKDHQECFGGCNVAFGTLRCNGAGPEDALCSGP